jgi:tetratricopeptide (TPR) repeat protein
MRFALAFALALEPVSPPSTDAGGVVDDSPVEQQPAPAPKLEPAADAATLFRLGRYREAADAFAREHAINPDPALLFGRAAALKRSGDCLSALDAFEDFIAADPPQPDVEEAQRQIEDCRAIVEATAAAATQTSDASTYDSGTPPSDRARPQTRRHAASGVWYRDALGGALVGIGTPVLLTGVGLYAGSFALAGRPQPSAQSQHESRRETVRALAVSGIPLMAVGAAAVIAGAVRWALLARRKDRNHGGSSAAATPGIVWHF